MLMLDWLLSDFSCQYIVRYWLVAALASEGKALNLQYTMILLSYGNISAPFDKKICCMPILALIENDYKLQHTRSFETLTLTSYMYLVSIYQFLKIPILLISKTRVPST